MAEFLNSQIKNRKRVRSLAEVLTAEREVNAMLDLLDSADPSTSPLRNLDATFLEPACGTGNFLIEVLARKCDHIPAGLDTQEMGLALVRTLASLYGIDISLENVLATRERLLEFTREYASSSAGEHPDLVRAASAVLKDNIQCADALDTSSPVLVVSYNFSASGDVTREVYPLTPGDQNCLPLAQLTAIAWHSLEPALPV